MGIYSVPDTINAVRKATEELLTQLARVNRELKTIALNPASANDATQQEEYAVKWAERLMFEVGALDCSVAGDGVFRAFERYAKSVRELQDARTSAR